MNRKYRKGEANLIGTFGVSGLSAYLLGVIQGYVQGFIGEHRAVKRVLFPITALILVFFIIHLSTPIFPLLKKETEPAVSIAQAAEKEKITSPASEGGAAGKEEQLEEKKAEIGKDKTESQEAVNPLDDSILEPSDVYAERNSSVVFQAYHPRAREYQWEIETESGQWEKASPEKVSERMDELQRNVSLLEVAADKEKAVRCRIRAEKEQTVTYAATLHILSGTIDSISVDEFSAEVGKYVNAGEIPVEITYPDGKQEVITGLNGLHFLNMEESKESVETAAGNLQETITTVKTACDYSHLETGTTEETLCYRKQDGETLEVPVNLKGLDLTAPVIKELHIGDFEVSKVDQPVLVTVSVSAEDDTTPVRQLTYAFLPEGEEIQEDDWMEESTFTMEITKNGVWIVYCKDAAGNIATAERELVVVDSKAPTISISLQNKETWCRENTIYVSAEDSLPVEYRYICTKLGEDSGWLVESSKDVGANGIWAIQVRDAAGNIAEQEIEVSNIDTQAPIIRSITEKTEGETVKNEE